MSRVRKKKNTGVIIFCILLTIALILAGCIAVVLFFKNTDPDKYNAIMDELRGVEQTESQEIIIETEAPIASEQTDSVIESQPDDEEVSFTITNEFRDMIGEIDTGKAQVKQNDDGTVTITMKKADHTDMLNGVAEHIEKTISDSIISGEFANVTAITHNDDFTDIQIMTENAGDYGELSAYNITIDICLLSRLYQQLQGRENQVVNMRFVAPDGTEYLSQHYPSE